MSVLVSDAEYKGLYDLARKNIDTIPHKVIEDAIKDIENHIKMLEDEGDNAVDHYIIKGLNTAVNILKKHIAEVENE